MRPIQQKIPDIKAYRSLTRFLGQLRIPSCFYIDTRNVWVHEPNGHSKVVLVTDQFNGASLSECKKIVERTFQYQVDYSDMIAAIKKSRKFMGLLHDLNIKNADYGLAVCKGFVSRMKVKAETQPTN